jgi:hypothetical protein
VASEIDATRQEQLYAEISDMILDECWAQPLCSNPVTLMMASRVHGLYVYHEDHRRLDSEITDEGMRTLLKRHRQSGNPIEAFDVDATGARPLPSK